MDDNKTNEKRYYYRVYWRVHGNLRRKGLSEPACTYRATKIAKERMAQREKSKHKRGASNG
jgi:hypothetical protein